MTTHPTAAELLEAVSGFIETRAAPQLTGRDAFLARVAVNALAVVKRELAQGPAADAAAAERLAALLAGYAAGGGRPVSLAEVKYWQAVGSLKWAVMCLMMYAAYASGRDASVERAMIGRRTSEAEIDLVALMEQAA